MRSWGKSSCRGISSIPEGALSRCSQESNPWLTAGRSHNSTTNGSSLPPLPEGCEHPGLPPSFFPREQPCLHCPQLLLQGNVSVWVCPSPEHTCSFAAPPVLLSEGTGVELNALLTAGPPRDGAGLCHPLPLLFSLLPRNPLCRALTLLHELFLLQAESCGGLRTNEAWQVAQAVP